MIFISIFLVVHALLELKLLSMFPALNYTCSVQRADRRDCGWPGVIAAQCRAAGCCWDESILTAYWCFFQHGKVLVAIIG